MYLGLDGYKKGWVCVSIDDHGCSQIDFLCDIHQLDQRSYKMAMIDIPIGLPASETRVCDQMGRDFLAEHRSRVFTGARRPLLSAQSHLEAHEIGRRIDGTGVPLQLFHILKKIREVDDFVQRSGQKRFRESHPELVFQRLGGAPVCKKKSSLGREQRIRLLEAARISGVSEALKMRKGKRAKIDDVLDAYACAIAARDCANGGNHVVPPSCPAPKDSEGLKMQIWY
jgi:predicted RNase H-like nuclease